MFFCDFQVSLLEDDIFSPSPFPKYLEGGNLTLKSVDQLQLVK